MVAGQKMPKRQVKPYRRALQCLVLVALVLVPFYSQNPSQWAPSRIVLGQMPTPATLQIAGDTWSFSADNFSISHPLAFIDAWVSGKVVFLPLLFSMLIPLALTIVMGRFFCSWFCPVGFLLEMNLKTRNLLQKIGVGWNYPFRDMRYIVLCVCLLLAFFLALPVLSIVDPPHVLGRELMNLFTNNSVTLAGGVLLLGLVGLDTFVAQRASCSKLCPSGGGLSLLGSRRLLKIHMVKEECVQCAICNEQCPYQLAPMNLALAHDFDWTKCDNCGLCRDNCPTGAIEFTMKIQNS